MYCKKCGAEIKTEAKFCPVCGEAVTRSSGNHGKNRRTLQDILPGNMLKPILAAVAVLGAIVLIFSMIFGKGKPDAETLVKEEFAALELYAGNEDLYERCVRTAVSELGTAVSQELGISTLGVDQLIGALAAELTAEYVADPELTYEFGSQVRAYSSLETGKLEKNEDGGYIVSVTVDYLDVAEASRLLAENIAAYGAQYLSGEASAFEDEFFEDTIAGEAKGSYTGWVQIAYEKEAGEWNVTSMDPKLAQAYYGMK